MNKQIGVVRIDGMKRPVIRRGDGRLFAGDTVDLAHPSGQGGTSFNAKTMAELIAKISSAKVLAERQ